mgnify:FL=1
MNKKLFMYLIIILLIIIFLFVGWFAIKNHKNNKKINEYIPEEEISTKQLRMTNISLFFLNEENGEIGEEIKQIDSKELLNNPEEKLINYLIEGPKNEKLKKIIPENIKLINIEKNNGILLIEFSENISNLENYEKIKKAIIQTVSQLNEINNIKIINN